MKTTALILFEDHPPETAYPNHGIIEEQLSNSLSSSFTLCLHSSRKIPMFSTKRSGEEC